MIEEVYDYLREYGFSKEEVNSFQDENEEMFFTNLEEIEKNINFLINKELSKEEILEVIKKDPYILTVKNNRLDYLEKIYKEGAEKAEYQAMKTLRKVYKKVGFIPRQD